MARVGVISDTHDNLNAVRAAVALFRKLRPELVVHCGDFVAQFTLAEFRAMGLPLRGVFGNCDGDRPALKQRADEAGFSLVAGMDRFEFGGRRFTVSHEPVAPPPDCDWYLHGHTHRLRHEPGRPAIVNPGEASGWLFGRSTVALLDTDSGEVEFLDLKVTC